MVEKEETIMVKLQNSGNAEVDIMIILWNSENIDLWKTTTLSLTTFNVHLIWRQ